MGQGLADRQRVEAAQHGIGHGQRQAAGDETAAVLQEPEVFVKLDALGLVFLKGRQLARTVDLAAQKFSSMITGTISSDGRPTPFLPLA